MQTSFARFVLTTVTWCCLLVGAVIGSESRPNIVWIIADDLSPDLGCYGYQGVRTPNIDRIAQQGARYTQAFATAPVCSSSRSAFITGVYQTTTGTHQHRTKAKTSLPDPVEPITEILRRAGYFVCNSNGTMKRPGKGDYNFRPAKKMYDAVDWKVEPGGRKADQPFFAQIQMHEPHRDFLKAEPTDRAKTAKIPTYYPEHPVTRADWANYLISIEELDRKVGLVLKRLKKERLLENTVVFFFGDHGRPHYRDKQWLYDGGIQVPLLVRWPKRIQPSVRDELVSLLDVSAATVRLAGAKIPSWMHGQDLLSEGFAGHPIIFAARDRCGSTLDRIRCVRTRRFKYIRNYHPERPYSQHSGYKVLQYPALTVAKVLQLDGKLTPATAPFWADRRPAEELYDLNKDPEELTNLVSEPSLQPTRIAMRKALDQWVTKTNDQGRFPERDVQAAIESSEKWFRGRMKKRGLSSKTPPREYLLWWEKQLGL